MRFIRTQSLFARLVAFALLLSGGVEVARSQPSARSKADRRVVEGRDESLDSDRDERADDLTTVDGADETNDRPNKSLLESIRAGGPLMIPILICSFVLCAFVFERGFALRRGRVAPTPFVKRFFHQLDAGQLDREQALALCRENGSPTATMFLAAIGKWGRASVEVEQAVLDSGERAVTGLRKHLRVLNGISTISPLLGLLGTVCGMITAFDDIAAGDAMGRPEQLATGIGQALLTTAAGLLVAIPALISYLYFVGRVDQLTVELDGLGHRLASTIAADGPQSNPRASSSRSARREAA